MGATCRGTSARFATLGGPARPRRAEATQYQAQQGDAGSGHDDGELPAERALGSPRQIRARATFDSPPYLRRADAFACPLTDLAAPRRRVRARTRGERAAGAEGTHRVVDDGLRPLCVRLGRRASRDGRNQQADGGPRPNGPLVCWGAVASRTARGAGRSGHVPHDETQLRKSDRQHPTKHAVSIASRTRPRHGRSAGGPAWPTRTALRLAPHPKTGRWSGHAPGAAAPTRGPGPRRPRNEP
jgi:hypothetical protein